MKALVVYESMFGNTQKIAEAVAKGLSSRMKVDLVEVGSAPNAFDNETVLLVVGGPTHAFGISRENTRRQAAEQAKSGLVSRGRGLREWLSGINKAQAPAAAVAFDTRLAKPGWLAAAGTAGRAIDKRLHKLGLRVVASPEGFMVEGVSGPLLGGEIDRARRWGEELASKLPLTEANRPSRS